MRILLNMMKYDYGNPKQGLSFEYEVFGSVLKRIKDAEVELFDYGQEMEKKGQKEMNRGLIERCKKFRPDLIFTFLFETEIYPETFKEIRNYSRASITWMADDKWRWEIFGSKYCNNFDYVITTDPDALDKYKSIGYETAILSQWAVDPVVYMKKGINKDIDVSFVGRANPWRKYVVKELLKEGINVECYGFDWGNGRVTQEEMIDIFNRSKINLNLSNSVKFDLKYLLDINLSWDSNKSLVKNIYSVFGSQINTIVSKKRKEDIKARFFEVIGCGGFLLSYNVEFLNDYFTLGKELVIYGNTTDLANKIEYYLKNEKEREKIANSGYDRVIKEHTYEKRFIEIFKRMSKQDKVFDNISFK